MENPNIPNSEQLAPVFNVGNAALMIAVLTLLSRVMGFVRDILLTSHLGISRQLDIYDTAFRLPDTIFSLLILGTLSAAFVPVFTSFYIQDKQRAQLIANSVLNIATIGMAVICLLLYLFVRPLTHWVAPGFSGHDFEQTVSLSRIMLLSPLIFTIANIFNGYLTSMKRFFVINSVPILYNLCIIGGIIWLYPRWGLTGLGIGVIIGALVMLLAQIIAAFHYGFRWHAVMDFHDSGVRTIGKLFVPRIFALDISFISLLIASVIGSQLQSGSIAAYNRAYNLESVVIGIFALSLITALFPVLSSLYAEHKHEQFVATIRDSTIRILFFAIPATVLTLLFRAYAVRIAYGHGKVDWHGTILIFNTLGVLAFGIIGQSLTPLYARAFFARHNTITPFMISLCSTIINIILSYWAALHYGVIGIALGFTIASVFDAILLFITLRMQIGAEVSHMETVFDLPVLKAIMKIIVATLFMGVLSYAMLYFLAPLFNTSRAVGIILQAGIAASAGIATYVILTILMGFKDLQILIRRFKPR